MAVDRMLVGKRAELLVFDELLKRGVIPYTPLVDCEGIDAMIRTPDGYHLEIQVKKVETEESPRWFLLRHLKASPILVIVCVEPDNTV